MKNILGTITVILAFIGYVPYIRDTFLGKTKPHVISWFLWTIVSFLAFALQWSKGAGAGSYANFAMGVICLLIFILSLKNGSKQIKPVDIVSFILAGFSIYLWQIVSLPTLAITLVVLIDLFSFIPTFVKSWAKPREETLSTWLLSTLRQALILLSLGEINYVTVIFPLYAFTINSIFCGLLIYRRKKIQLN